MDAPSLSLEAILAQCWTLLEQGASNRRHGFHHPTVSTIGLDGKPKARTVILRNADKKQATLRFHSDVRTSKWQELKQNPNLALVFYDEAQRVQLRVEGRATVHTNDEEARNAWLMSQSMSRVCYGIMPAPGTEISGANAYSLPERDETATLGYENFGAVITKVDSIEWLFLKQARNQRAFFDCRNRTARWLVP